jgi:hypothetical protein
MIAVALGAAGIGALAESKASPAAKSAPGRSLTLYAPHLHQKPVGPKADGKVLPFGDVVDAKDRHLGAFHSAALDSTGGSLTMQTFDLADGTIVGIGSDGNYVVVGGTGAYAGVAGAYEERSAARLPGRQFTFTFREGTHGSS